MKILECIDFLFIENHLIFSTIQLKSKLKMAENIENQHKIVADLKRENE